MTIKLGRENIQRLIARVIEKQDIQTGKPINRNQTVANYAGLASQLTALSTRLPELDATCFVPDNGGRYIITGAQVRDAYFGKVDSLKDHFYEACHLYLFDKLSANCKSEIFEVEAQAQSDEAVPVVIPSVQETKKPFRLSLISVALLLVAMVALYQWYSSSRRLSTLIRDMKILPYKPTTAEIEALTGVWLIHTGSPQARKWDTGRYHMTVPNMMEINYKDGYFVFNRFGPAFNQDGYMQFEAPGVVSIHSRVLNDSGNMVAPKHSLMVLEKGKSALNVISASWNFDTEDNRVIGIREVYIKKGKGELYEIKNSLAATRYNSILQWTRPDKQIDTIFLNNQRLEGLNGQGVGELLNENSILLKDPDESLIIRSDANAMQPDK